MGAVDTTYTFTATDTITSAKMNNIIDQTTITTDAIIGTTLEVASGKLKIRSQGITSNEMGNNSVVTAAITDSNVTQAKLASNVVGNGPAFRAWGQTITSIASGVTTKITLDVEDFDTNSNFSSSRFTPTVAGYYFIKGAVATNGAASNLAAIIYKNGLVVTYGPEFSAGSFRSHVSDVIYLNGVSDYVELYGYHLAGSNRNTSNAQENVFMSGFLARSA
jgi:hypothetical protein